LENEMTTKHYVWVGVLAIITAIMVSMSGCELGDFIHVKTPTGIQQTYGYPPSLTLNEWEGEFQKWQDGVRADGQMWVERGASARAVKSAVSSILMQGMEQGSGLLGTAAPWLVPFLPGILGLGGLFLRRPGDVTPKEKEKAYNKGLEEGKRLSM
jgi:hypothetical protein